MYFRSLMKLLKNFLFITFFSTAAQTTVTTEFLNKEILKVDDIVALNNFGFKYLINGNAFILQKKDESLEYSNVQFGTITTTNAFNPLKINLFYKDFNTAIILDNRLAEIFKIDFNTIQPYKNVSRISTGYDNTLWIFNQDSQQLELYDYKANITRVKTLPIQGNILDMKSSYNYCWLLTEKFLFVYNYFGSLIKKIKNDGFTEMAESNENLILKKDGKLFYLEKDTVTPIPISISNLLINRFLVTNETLYIYDHVYLHEFKLKTN